MTLLLIIFGITYALIATERMDKAIAAILGASVVIFMGYISYEDALHTIDLNVIFLLVGMMVVINILGKTGVFEWLAITMAQKAKGNGLVILMMFLISTAFISAMLDNVTTVLLMAPVTLLIAQLLELPVAPFLIFMALSSNIGGTATLVGDPPNVLIGSATGLTFNEFIIHMAPIATLITGVFLVMVWFTQRRNFTVSTELRARVMTAQADLAIVHPQLLKRSLIVLVLILLGFFVGPLFHIEPGIVALAGGMLMLLVGKVNIHHALEKVEWTTIFFFIGLFMLVGALEHNHVFTLLGEQVVRISGGNLLLTCQIILWTAAIASAIVDNIPLVIALIPLLESVIPGFATSMGLAEDAEIRKLIMEPLYWSLALGACLGGNGSLIGASANVVVCQIANRNKYPITFMHFSRLGIPIMLMSLVCSSVYIWLRYF
jgi:Na+/H+ antiporter NhaD/arsenite permease-like protein